MSAARRAELGHQAMAILGQAIAPGIRDLAKLHSDADLDRCVTGPTFRR